MNQVTLSSPLLATTTLGEAIFRMCEVDTSPGREDALLPVLLPWLEDLGARIHLQPVGEGRTNILAQWGDPKVLFSTHTDTVAPFVAPRWEGERIFGRGTCDAKGQAVTQLAAIRQLLSEGAEGMAWLGVVGEETDSAGAREAMSLADRMPNLRLLVNGEPTDLKLATGQRGVTHLRLRVEGLSAHSSLAHMGRSAAWPLIEWLHVLQQVELPVDSQLGAEVWNLGLMEAGEAVNSVPAHAEAHILARTVPGTRIAAEARRLAPTYGTVETLLEETWDHYPRIEGFEYAAMPFGSDAPCLRALVADGTLALVGPGSITVAHSLNENITTQEVLAGVDLCARLAKRFL